MRNPSSRKLLLALSAVCVVAAASTLGEVGAEARVSSTCKASQLRGHLLGSSGAAGTITLSITLRNIGAACTLKGYAGLHLTTHADPLPTRVLHDGFAPLNQKARTVLLARNGRATILIAYSDVLTGSEKRCPSSTGLLVRPPGQTHWISVAVKAQACNHGALRESPVLAGVRHAP
jgi:hypothetical protein